MKLGIFAKTFAGTEPLAVLTAAAAAGFSNVQYNMSCSGMEPMPEYVGEDKIRAIASATREAKVSVAALSGTYNMIHPDMRVRRDGHRRLAAVAAAASAMGTGLITLCTGTRDPVDQWQAHQDNQSPQAWRDLLESMETAIGIAERHNVMLGIEPELANVVDSAAKARQLIDELGSARVKIVIDPANLFEIETLERQRKIVSEAIQLLSDSIIMGHAKDREKNGNFAAAGKGVLDYRHYLSCLKDVGFMGPLVTHGLGADEAQGVASFLRRAIEECGIETSQ